jgi:hypothetical protein
MTDRVIKKNKRVGINKDFPAVNEYVDLYGITRVSSEEALNRLTRYGNGGGFLFSFFAGGHESFYNFSNAKQDLLSVAEMLRWDAIQSALRGGADWHLQWVRSIAYQYWETRFQHRVQMRILVEFQNKKRQQYAKTVSLRRSGALISDCLVLGWQEMALDLTQRIIWALNNGGCPDGNDESHRRAQFFVLRLMASWKGTPDLKGPVCAFDEPLFNSLIEHWRTPNPDELAPLLLAACDRHVNQSLHGDILKGMNYDFSVEYWYTPFEVLIVLKLRELIGLQNPELSHPLLATPLGQLPQPVPAFTDELLESVLFQARRESPDL